MTPLLSELMRDLALQQPKDLNGYLIGVLTERVKVGHTHTQRAGLGRGAGFLLLLP